MSALNTQLPSYLDVIKREDPDGKIADIIELMTDQNPVLKDMPAIEGNLPTGHKHTQRTGLPTATWRKLNYGIVPSKARTTQVTDACGMLEALSKIDVDLAKLNGNDKAWRLSENMAFMEAMNQEIAETLFYGDEHSAFMGLAPRYSATSTTKGTAGYNIIGAGGTGNDNASMWLVHWGRRATYSIFPKAGKTGLTHKDLGEKLTDDGTDRGAEFMAFVDHFKWDIGLACADPRANVRVPNIDISDLKANSGSQANLIELMTQAVHKVPASVKMGTKPVFYVSESVATWLDIQAQNKTNVHLTSKEWHGMDITHFRNIPIVQCDALLETEDAVS